MSTLAPRKKEAFFILSLLLVYFAIAFLWQDIHAFDDSYYLDSGLHLHLSSFFRELNIAPLYALWFRILQIGIPDPVWRYFASWALLVAIAVFLPFWMGVRGTWFYAFVLLALPFFRIAPYVSFFACIFLLAGMAYLLRHTLDIPGACFLACIASFPVALCRPEYAYGVLVCAVAFAVATVFTPRAQRSRQHWFYAALVLLFSLTTAVILHNSDSSRSGIAFAQHFNKRANEKHLIPPGQNYWTSDYAMRAFHVDLGRNAASTHATIMDFAHANRSLFLGHILANLFDPRTLALALAVFVLALWPWINPTAARLRAPSVYLLLIYIPTLIADVVIYPRNHYTATVAPALLLYLCELIDVPAWHLRFNRLWLIPVAALLILLSGLGPKLLLKRSLEGRRSGLAAVQCLRRFESSAPSSSSPIFDSAGLPPVYLQSAKASLEIFNVPNWKGFESTVENGKVGLLLITPATAPYFHVAPDVLDAELVRAGDLPHPCPNDPDLTLYAHSIAQQAADKTTAASYDKATSLQ